LIRVDTVHPNAGPCLCDGTVATECSPEYESCSPGLNLLKSLLVFGRQEQTLRKKSTYSIEQVDSFPILEVYLEECVVTMIYDMQYGIITNNCHAVHDQQKRIC
jgi:hypothetical protein